MHYICNPSHWHICSAVQGTAFDLYNLRTWNSTTFDHVHHSKLYIHEHLNLLPQASDPNTSQSLPKSKTTCLNPYLHSLAPASPHTHSHYCYYHCSDNANVPWDQADEPPLFCSLEPASALPAFQHCARVLARRGHRCVLGGPLPARSVRRIDCTAPVDRRRSGSSRPSLICVCSRNRRNERCLVSTFRSSGVAH